MPAALPIVDLGAFAIALFATLLAIGVYLLIRALAQALTLHLPIVGSVDLGGAFTSALNSVDNWIVNTTKGMWADLGALFRGTAWMIGTLFDDVVSAVGHLGDQIAHIVTTEIPDAVRSGVKDAEDFATRAVATVEADVRTAERDIAATLKAADRAIYEAAATADATIGKDIRAAVAHAVDEAEGFTTREVKDARDYTDVQFKAAEAAAAAAVGDLSRTLGGQLSSLTSTVQQNLASAEDYARSQAQQAIQTAEQFAQGQATAAVSTAEAALTPEITAAQTAANAAAAAAAGAATTASQAATTAAGAVAAEGAVAAGAAAGAITSVLGDVYTDITGQSIAAGGDLTSVEGLLAGAILTAVGAVAVRVAKLEACSVGICPDSPNNFSSLLNDVLGLAEFAGIGAFLAQIISDPYGAEQTYASAVQDVYSVGQSAFQTVLSL